MLVYKGAGSNPQPPSQIAYNGIKPGVESTQSLANPNQPAFIYDVVFDNHPLYSNTIIPLNRIVWYSYQIPSQCSNYL